VCFVCAGAPPPETPPTPRRLWGCVSPPPVCGRVGGGGGGGGGGGISDIPKHASSYSSSRANLSKKRTDSRARHDNGSKEVRHDSLIRVT